MGRPKGKRARPADREDAWFGLMQELRDELRADPELPANYNPVLEMAKLGQRTDIGPALKFLCDKEVATYMYPRMEAAPTVRSPIAQGAIAGPAPVTKFLPGATR
jgi:hypothetical protein